MGKFVTSARAVDMLGRQQIAGVPTAVSEIFKNSYDAYALNVRGDYFPDRNVMTFRDDGIGMSARDFGERWLTIGTDSKARDSTKELPRKPAHMPERLQMGEKGIGRLAIATIGPQLLVVTRARDADEWLVALAQWSFFAVPGLTLDDVPVPTRSLTSFASLNPSLVEDLQAEVLASLEVLGDRVPRAAARSIRAELELLPLDITPYLRLNGPSLELSSGTAFIVSAVGVDVDSAMLIEAQTRDPDLVSPFQRSLLGFANTMITDDSPVMNTEFVLHEATGFRDLIDPRSFWRPEDFGRADHIIEGRFDEFGQFAGTVSIYGKPPIPVVEPWNRAGGGRSSAGAFAIKFGYVQGEKSGSRLTGEEFSIMNARLERLGGLYVYRDGIRVLPYGNSDWDYLEIEQRRSLNAGRYYFSYRRMFGAIEVSSGSNPALLEKAGREGFRDNQAYRDFNSILRNFLIQLAATYFSAKSSEGEEWRKGREQLKARSSGRSDRAARDAAVRAAFAERIAASLESFDSGQVARDVAKIVERARRDARVAEEIDSAGDLDAAERRAVEALANLADSVLLERPPALALSVEQDRDWDALQRRTEDFRSELRLAGDELGKIVEVAQRKIADRSIDHSARRRDRMLSRGTAHSEQLSHQREGLDRAIQIASGRLKAEAEDSLQQFYETLREVDSSALPVTAQYEIESLERMESAYQRAAKSLQLLHSRVVSLGEEKSERDLVLLQEEVLDLRGQLDENLEVLQLGQAVQLVSHEFESNIRAIRRSIQELTPWAKSTPRLAPVVRDIRASFAHLDAYLRLFTPLQRRLYRQATTFSGDDILSFVRGVFDKRLQEEAVTLDASAEFRACSISGYPSTFYPAFLNLIDNAIHWAGGAAESVNGSILLDAEGDTLSIEDNGPGVRPRDREVIFERGFSRRRGGRGLGLSLARDLLQVDGWELTLDTSFDEGARFLLRNTNRPEELDADS